MQDFNIWLVFITSYVRQKPWVLAFWLPLLFLFASALARFLKGVLKTIV